MNTNSQHLIEGWFRETGGGGLLLPDGWFGRPYDNIHQLTFFTVRPMWLIIELDSCILLTIRQAASIQRSNSELVISGFSSCVFDRREYAGDRCYLRTYTEGEIRLVAPPGRVE